MVNAAGGNKKKRRGHRLPRYFFLNGDLHKRLRVTLPLDYLEAWSYPLNKRVGYTYSDVLKKFERGWKTQEVAKMIGRHYNRVYLALVHEQIPLPQRASSASGDSWKYIWSEKDIMNLHDFFLTVHRGKPRLDGQITPQAMPTKRELRALLRQNQVMYVKTEDGEFVPTWQAHDF